MSTNQHLSELDEAARRAGFIVTEQIGAIIERAERQAEMIRRDARRDAEDMRREAHDAAKRLLDRLEALEFPLGQLVVSLREEVEHVAREMEAGLPVDSDAASLPSETRESSSAAAAVDGAVEEATDAPAETSEAQSDDEPEDPTTSERGERDYADAWLAAEPPAASPDPSGAVPETRRGPPPGASNESKPMRAPHGYDTVPRDDHGPESGHRSRHRGGTHESQGLFITEEGHCAVCNRRYAAGSAEELAASGWRVKGDVGICPRCQAEVWLPEAARPPARPAEP